MSSLRTLVAVACTAGLALGCGGGGGGSVDSSAFAGSYRAAFDRAGTHVLVLTDSTGGVEVTLSDDTGVLAFGTGTVAGSGVVSAALSGRIGSVSAGGAYSLIGEEPRLTLDLAGAVSAVGLSLTRTGSPGLNPFAAAYVGTYQGSESGTWDAFVETGNRVTGVVRSPLFGTMTLSGRVDSRGQATWTAVGASGAPPPTMTWTGQFSFTGDDVRAEGTWIGSTGGGGGWSGRRD